MASPANLRTTPLPAGPDLPAARIALVGDRSPAVRAHGRIPGLLTALAERDQLVLDAYWIPTEEIDTEQAIDGFDAVWIVPGSPYRNEEGALIAARTAREQGIPLLGTCGGFQHAVLEFARTVCGLTGAGHAENAPDALDPVILPLACSLVGHEGAVLVEAGSLAEQILGVERTVERFHCSYGVNPAHLDTLRAHGLRFSGVDETGDIRIAELPGHPFFLATLFQPELAGDGTWVHPLIRAFGAAAVARAAAASSAPFSGSAAPVKA